MGIAANQARLLSITARLADVEYQTEALTASKLRLATQSSQEARNYSSTLYDIQSQRQEALDGSTLFSGQNLYMYSVTYEGKTAKEWEMLVNSTSSDNENYTTYVANYNEAMQLVQQKMNEDTAANSAYTEASKQFDALERQAEMEHEIVLQDIKNKEAAIDMEINPLQAEHEALKTEKDSLQSLIKDNTDKSFNLFS